MRFLIQRVTRASVRIDGKLESAIGTGLLVLIGISTADGQAEADYLAEKLVNLRVFPDSDARMNCSAIDVNAALLLVSQFTLYGDCRKGRRPGFDAAAPALFQTILVVEVPARMGVRVDPARHHRKAAQVVGRAAVSVGDSRDLASFDHDFLVLEDGVPQTITSVRMTQTPITAVMLLEFAANSYYFIRDMQNASYVFFRSLRPDDYIAVITYDLRTHILTDFTNNKDTVGQAISSLVIPGFSDTNTFDALYETLDRVSRVEGRKYIIMIGTGRDTFSKITLDKILAKVKATPNVTIFTIGTGAFLNEMAGGRGGMGGSIRDLNYLQAQNQLKTFASMTGGLSFSPVFQGELPDIFSQINDSIRNQYVLTYRPTNNKNDGSYRKVKVLLVDNEGHPLQMQDEKHKPLKYSVIARDGYKAKQQVE